MYVCKHTPHARNMWEYLTKGFKMYVCMYACMKTHTHTQTHATCGDILTKGFKITRNWLRGTSCHTHTYTHTHIKAYTHTSSCTHYVCIISRVSQRIHIYFIIYSLHVSHLTSASTHILRHLLITCVSSHQCLNAYTYTSPSTHYMCLISPVSR
jgi:hypothetical protein